MSYGTKFICPEYVTAQAQKEKKNYRTVCIEFNIVSIVHIGMRMARAISK